MMRVPLLAAAALSLAMAAGCDGPQRQEGTAAPAGTPGPSVTGSAPPQTTTPTTPIVRSGGATPTPTARSRTVVEFGAPCQANQLTGDIEQFERPGQAGASQSARVRFTNTGRPCTMVGYIGLQLLTAEGQRRETRVVRGGDPPRRVTLDRGESAWALIDWKFTPNGDELNTQPLCGPKPTAALVTPPGAAGAIRIAENFGTVCQHGQIYTTAVSTTPPS